MSLQMPPDGGSYRDRRADVFLPDGLIAKTAEGQRVPLPDRVPGTVLRYVPSSVARECRAFPVGLTGRGKLCVLLIEDRTDHVESVEKLRFILNREIRPCFAPQAAVEALIDQAYLDGAIENCDFRYVAWCPKRFEKLDPADDARCRVCPVCSSPVRYCDSEDAVRVRTAAGLVSARYVEPEPTEILQEFVDAEVDVEPSSSPPPPIDLRALFGSSPPPPRPRYEILELPEFFRQEREAAREASSGRRAGDVNPPSPSIERSEDRA